MRFIKCLVIGLLIVASVDSCIKQPEYSAIPYIELQSITYKKNASTGDSIFFTIKFKDGDGDLGINGDETEIDTTDIASPSYYAYDTLTGQVLKDFTGNLYRFHEVDLNLGAYFKDQGGTKHYYYAPNLSYVNYKAKRTIAAFSGLPEKSCKYWSVENTKIKKQDTIYFIVNPSHDNFLVDMYTKNPDNTYSYFDPTTFSAFGGICYNNFFYGRFPVLSADLGKQSPLDGTLTFRAGSLGLYQFFHAKTVKFKIRIIDRAFHTSNVIETKDYTFY